MTGTSNGASPPGTRRGFINGLGAGAALALLIGGAARAATSPVIQPPVNPAQGLTIGTSAGATGTLNVIGAPGSSRVVNFHSGDPTSGSNLRWSWGVDSTAEGGSNTGSNVLLRAYSDLGALLSTPISVTRSSGLVTFAGAVTFNGTPTAVSQLNIGTNSASTANLSLNGAIGVGKTFTLSTAGSVRWQEGATNATESGSNAGSDRFWNAFSDTGTLIGTPLKLTRATLLTQFGGGAYLFPGTVTLSGATQSQSQIGFSSNQTYAGSMSGGGEVYANQFSIVDTCIPSPGHAMSWFAVGGQQGNPSWAQNTVFATNAVIDNGGKTYKATTGGTSSNSGTGPSGTGGSIADGTVTWAYQGPSWGGKRTTMNFSMNIRSQSSSASDADKQIQTLIATTSVSANQGGTSTANGQTQGFFYASADQMWAFSGATFLSGVIGRETDVGIFAGASAGQRTGMQVICFGDVQGAQKDIGYRLAAAKSGANPTTQYAPGFLYGMGFDNGAIDQTNGILLGYVPPIPGSLSGGIPEPAPKAKHGIYLSNYLISGYAFCSAGGFGVTGTGALNIGGGQLSSSTAGLNLTVNGVVVTGGTINNGGGGYSAGDQVLEPQTGSIFTVSSVSGGTITGLVLTQAGGAVGSITSTGAALVGGSGSGNATVNLTTTAITTLNLNPSAGNIKLGNASGSIGFFGGAGATKPTVSGSKASNAALASLLAALSGLGLLADSTT